MSGRILVVDDVATNRIVLRACLTTAFYDVLLASDGMSALRLARRRQPDLIVLDAMMPGLDGFETCRRLRQDRATADIPVVMVSAVHDAKTRLRALDAGAEALLAKPVNEAALLARLRSLLREQAQLSELRARMRDCAAGGFAEPIAAPPVLAPAAIRVVCADPARAAHHARALAARLPHHVLAASPASIMATERGGPVADVIILCPDSEAGTALPLALLADLRSRPATRDAAIIAVLPGGALADVPTVMDLGANDYIFAGAEPQELAARIDALLRRRRRAQHLRAHVRAGLRMAVTDPLTGLHNRRFALRRLDQLAARCARRGQTLAVLLVDIDRFKAINDRHGHPAGDLVLAAVADRLRACTPRPDLIARYGGEEFILAQTGSTAPAACALAEQLRGGIADRGFAVPGRISPIPVTLCVGVSLSAPGRLADPADLIAAADRALYASKEGGRNSIRLAGAPAA